MDVVEPVPTGDRVTSGGGSAHQPMETAGEVPSLQTYLI